MNVEIPDEIIKHISNIVEYLSNEEEDFNDGKKHIWLDIKAVKGWLVDLAHIDFKK